jgi:hypothetical protein
MTRPEVLPICLEVSSVQLNIPKKRKAYQEHNRNVQSECNKSVQQENKVSNLLDVSPGHLGHLDDQADDSVHDSASRREVVKRDERVHLELSG